MKLTAALKTFISTEAWAGIALVCATILALIAANTGLKQLYEQWLRLPLFVGTGPYVLSKPLILWINDGLMAVFFFVVGLEIKREFKEGELSSPRKAILPVAAALGGMVVPALVYVALNMSNPITVHGWAIPAATDIAFAVGILALLGPQVPPTLKIFLLALAIMDDLGAIVIIALFYNHGVHLIPMAVAGFTLLALFAINLRGLANVGLYIALGLVLWLCLLKSGIHASVAGVILAFFIPLNAASGKIEHSPLKNLEHTLHGWVAYGIMPLFAFANAGVSLEGVSLSNVASPVSVGILAGLFLGKQIGVLAFSWLAVRLDLARLPAGSSWAQFHGVCVLTGIGFTMSLFIGTLAFTDPLLLTQVRLGVLIASFLSALVGLFLLWAHRRSDPPFDPPS